MRPTNHPSIGRLRLATGLTLAACCGLGMLGANSASAGVEACPTERVNVNVRWHHSDEPPAGLWTDLRGVRCGQPFTLGPRPLDDTFTVSPGEPIKVGYDFTLPGNTKPFTVFFTEDAVVFHVRCLSGKAPSETTLTVALANRSYPVTNGNWYPAGSQTSPITYQGEAEAPSLCGGGQMKLTKGTFTGLMRLH